MKLLISLNMKPDLVRVIQLRVADGKIGVVVGVLLRKTNVGQSDGECAAESLNTIGCRHCAMTFFQSRRGAVRGGYIKPTQSCVVELVREVGAPLSGAWAMK